MAGERTEKASPKKREDERKKGHIYQSQDIVVAASLLCFFALLKVMGPGFGHRITQGMQKLLTMMPDRLSGPGDMAKDLTITLNIVAGILVPIMIVALAVTIIATMVQTRLLVSFNQLKPDFGRMSPIQGIKRLFSLKSLVELVKALLKITAIGLVIYFEIKPQLHQVLTLFDMSLGTAVSWSVQMILGIGIKAAIAMLVIGLGDYFYQWWNFEKEIKMSKEEIKEEFKQSEGNPETKSRIRGLQRKMSKERMMQAVPTADVVIRNPTHYAIALKYEANGSGAPIVVAKGQDNVALRIVEIAQQNHVFITENKPLAQALFKACDVGDEIPAQFYKTVAEVLAYIYRLKRAGRA